MLVSLLSSLALAGVTIAATADQWRTRSIYQVLTDRYARDDGSITASCITGNRQYCGGTFEGLANHLDYIQDLGFDAVWISPVTKNIEGQTAYGEAFHGYWQTDLYSINSHFGSPADLKNLSNALHERGMYLMVDIVPNHNGWNGAPSTVDFSSFNPFNSPDDYHLPYCSVTYDFSNTTNTLDCWLGDQNVPLPDLKTEAPNVAQGYQTWIKELVSNYSIDGLRIDTAIYIDSDFWSGFEEAAGVYMVGEVFNGDPSFSCPYQNYLPGILNFPNYYSANSAFSSTTGSISGLASSITKMQSTCKDVTVLGSFTENHDVPRFAFGQSDWSLAKNLLAYTILGDGIPIVYQGQEQHYAAMGSTNGNDPYNREALWYSGYNTQAQLAVLVKAVNAIRAHAGSTDSAYWTSKTSVVQSDSHNIVLSRGSAGKQVLAVLTNVGSGAGNSNLQINNSGYTQGTVVQDAVACGKATVGSGGSMNVAINGGVPSVYYPVSLLKGSGICGN
ncbi:glycoside hydrolase family 13 protein [Myriangium duriaei CBS 260.36]|uniref:alpha-amylase n=1 Tax=Myriangium duriaei CBS 260.36 TaxID=1168546 RepID=A0A9P4MFS1_9PEZI|nr:glycoside hydrolase family 13 protein [Myriangium duriaei CBS 260.36]